MVDFYHASEHLAAAQAAFGDRAEAHTWLTRVRHTLLVAGPDPVLAALAALTAPTPAAREVLRRERGYFRQHAERMAYHTLRLDDLPIGSGAIESAATHGVQIRRKRPGMRWSENGARAVLALRPRSPCSRPLPTTPRRLTARLQR